MWALWRWRVWFPFWFRCEEYGTRAPAKTGQIPSNRRLTCLRLSDRLVSLRQTGGSRVSAKKLTGKQVKNVKVCKQSKVVKVSE